MVAISVKSHQNCSSRARLDSLLVLKTGVSKVDAYQQDQELISAFCINNGITLRANSCCNFSNSFSFNTYVSVWQQGCCGSTTRAPLSRNAIRVSSQSRYCGHVRVKTPALTCQEYENGHLAVNFHTTVHRPVADDCLRLHQLTAALIKAPNLLYSRRDEGASFLMIALKLHQSEACTFIVYIANDFIKV